MPRARRIVTGKVNRLIDDLMHPYFKDHPALILVDGLLHAVVGQDPDVSFRKFVKYTAPKLLGYLVRKQK